MAENLDIGQGGTMPSAGDTAALKRERLLKVFRKFEMNWVHNFQYRELMEALPEEARFQTWLKTMDLEEY